MRGRTVAAETGMFRSKGTGRSSPRRPRRRNPADAGAPGAAAAYDVRMRGEFEWIRRVRTRADRTLGPGVVLGIGDDAAVLRPRPGFETVATVDALVEGVHFDRAWTPAEDLGRKAAAVNLSDLAAMGADPLALLAVLSVPATFADSDADAILEGLAAEAEAAGAALVGGDTVGSPGAVSISVTAIGEVPAGAAIRRSGARPGDVVRVTGALGGAAAGLESVRRGLGVGPAEARLLRPRARLAEGRALRGVADAAIDVSDGLLADLGRLAEASGVGVEVEAALVPVDPAALEVARRLDAAATGTGTEATARALGFALRGGEDYELAFTTPAAAPLPADLAAARIGRVVEERGLFLVEGGARRGIDPAGFDHFRRAP